MRLCIKVGMCVQQLHFRIVFRFLFFFFKWQLPFMQMLGNAT